MIIVKNFMKTIANEKVEHRYFYRMIKDQIIVSSNDSVKKLDAYGIEVERQDMCDGRLVNIERDRIKSISPYLNKVQVLLNLIFKGVVSPIHLIDVLGEYVDEYTYDFNNELKQYLKN